MRYNILFNPFNDTFYHGILSHSEILRLKGNISKFDDYIRGIIFEDVLYIRYYYPFDNIGSISLAQLKKASYSLIFPEVNKIKALIKNNCDININEVVYNVDNVFLKEKLQTLTV